MKLAILAVCLLMLTSCGKSEVESVKDGKPNIKIGMSIKDIRSLTDWDIKGKGDSITFSFTKGVSVFTEKGLVDSVRIVRSEVDLPFTIEGFDMENLSEISSYHNTERTQFIGGTDGLKTNAYTKDGLWLWYGSNDRYDMTIAIISSNAWMGYSSLDNPVPVFKPYDLKDMAKTIYKAHHCQGYLESLAISDTEFKLAQKSTDQNVSGEDIGAIRRYLQEMDDELSERDCNLFLPDFVQVSDEELQRSVYISKLEG